MKLLQKRHRLHGAWDMAAPCWKAGLAGQGLPAISRQILCFARLWEKDGGRRCWMSIAKGRVTCSRAGSAACNGTVAQRTSPWAWAERSCQAHQFCIAAPDAVARKGRACQGSRPLRHEHRDDTRTGRTRAQGRHWHRPSNLASVPLVRATCRPAPEPSGRRGSRSALFAGMLEVPRVDVCDIWLAHGQGVPTRIRGTASGSLQEKSAWACR